MKNKKLQERRNTPEYKQYAKKMDLIMKSKRGGARKGAGRKKLPKGERREPLTIHPKGEDIKKVGGTKRAKQIALNSIENYGG